MSETKRKIRSEVRRINACCECIDEWVKNPDAALSEEDCQDIVAECEDVIKLATKIIETAYVEERKLIAARKERQSR